MITDEKFLEQYGYFNSKVYSKEAIKFVRDVAEGRIKPLRTSIKAVNKAMYGYLPTDLTTVAGRSGVGKTTWLVQAIKDFTNVEINPFYEGKLAIFYDSWEISGWRNMLKFASSVERKTMSELLDYNERLQKESLDRIEKTLNSFNFGNNLFISEFSTTPVEWGVSKREIKEKLQGYQIVNFVDHLRLITKASYGTEESLLTEFMLEATKEKKKNKSITFLLSQMNRNIESGKDRREIGTSLPVTSDVFGADSITQFSDNLIGLHRPGLYGLKEFKIGDTTLKTGLENSDEDDLLLQCILKCRYGNLGTIATKHELKYNRIVDYKVPPKLNKTEIKASFNNL
jgi:replicative DNA helicase